MSYHIVTFKQIGGKGEYSTSVDDLRMIKKQATQDIATGKAEAIGITRDLQKPFVWIETALVYNTDDIQTARNGVQAAYNRLFKARNPGQSIPDPELIAACEQELKEQEQVLARVLNRIGEEVDDGGT